MGVRGERLVLIGVWAAAAVACLLGGLDRPGVELEPSLAQQLLALVRVFTTAALAVTLLLGPGLLWRATSERPLRLAFLPLPGLALLVATALLAWALAASVEPRLVCFAVLAPVLGLMLGALLGLGGEDLLEREEQRVLLVVALVLGVAVGRSLWSLGPLGELYEGSVAHTFVPEGRSDSRISYFIPALVNNGGHPYGSAATAFFAPYNFSSRGPLPGLASTPVVLMSGGNPPLAAPEAPWQPFDPQGFMAYRLAMIAFGSTALLSLWQLVRALGGRRAAWLALLLGAGTPFLFADLWFTWPKLFAATFVLLGAILLFERRAFRSGLSVGIGYLMHPSALVGLFALGPLSLWPLKGANWRRPQLLTGALLVLGAGLAVLAWRLVNGHNFEQEGFLEYVYMAYPDPRAPLGTWLHFRASSLANTYVPFYLWAANGDNISINAVGGGSPGSVHFFFQYWTGVPFGFGILFFPLLLASLWKAFRRWTWPILAVVAFPAVAFAVYWGASSSGMLREGMQSWVLAVLAVVALQQAAAGFPWLRSNVCRAILSLRGLEVLAVAAGATLATRNLSVVSGHFPLVDATAIATVAVCSLAIVALVWVETGRLGGRAAHGEDQRDRGVDRGEEQRQVAQHQVSG